MKNKCISAGLILAVFFSFVACEDNTNNRKNDDAYVNEWIYDNMSIYYLWNEKLPASPDYKLNPDDFFESICYWYNKDTNPDGDRFSWIQENYVDLLNLLSGVSSDEIGFEFMLYYLDDKQVDLFGEVEYVKRGTPAEAKGLKRGQTFTKINGTKLTVSNYQNLLMNLKGSYTLTVSDPAIVDNDISFQNEQTLSLSTMGKYEENPIYLDTVYTDNGRKIGYLVYNFFADDNGDGKCGYDAQLAQTFSKFKANNVTDLILDLRYNSGGSTFAATCLAGMIVKGLDTKNVFYRIEFNKLFGDYIRKQEGDDYFYQRFIDKIVPDKNTNNLTTAIPLVNIGNLESFYVLTGRNTASASEMIINGLRPYMNVTLVGDTTVGKNVASVSFYEEKDPKNKWGMQPIIAKMYNKEDKSDYTAGFYPNHLNRDMGIPKKQLGDLNESMLNETVSIIVGGTRSFKPVQTNPSKAMMSSVARKAWSNNMILNSQTILKPNKQ